MSFLYKTDSLSIRVHATPFSYIETIFHHIITTVRTVELSMPWSGLVGQNERILRCEVEKRNAEMEQTQASNDELIDSK